MKRGLNWLGDAAAEVDFIVALIPGRFDAPLAAWRARFDQARRHGASFVAFTETTGALRFKVAELLAPAFWEWVRHPEPGKNNCTAAYDPTVWRVEWHEPWLLTDDDLWHKGGHKIPWTYANVVLARHLADDRLALFVLVHLPLENTPRRKAAKSEALDRLDRLANEVRSTLTLAGIIPAGQPAPHIVIGDFNMNAKLTAVREWIQARFPGLPSWIVGGTYSTHGGSRGSMLDFLVHGRRLELLKVRRFLRDRSDPLDHMSQLFAFKWRRRGESGRRSV